MIDRFKHIFHISDCLFAVLKLTKNANSDKYVYSGYDISFDTHSQYSRSGSEWGKNVFF